MQKLMSRHRDEEVNAMTGERVTVADVARSAESYYSLADFVKVGQT